MNFFVLTLGKAGVVAVVLLTTLAYLQWVERKVIAHIQLRLGPSRVGPHGLLQPLADILKLMTKEDLLPPHVNRFLYLLAPILAVGLALTSISVIPFGPKIEVGGVETNMQLADLNIGVLFLLALSSVGVYGVALAGWASNNKYALLGGLRASAQMISYELPLALALASPLLMMNTLSLREIVDAQQGFALGFLPRWAVFQWPSPQVVAFFLFLIAGFAETNRVPFDLPEAENELVAGFHTEYSSMKFAMFFMAEYANMITVSCLATVLFFGGWHAPLPPEGMIRFAPALALALAAGMLFYHAGGAARGKQRWSMYLFGALFALAAAAFLAPAVRALLSPLFWFLLKTGFLLFVYIWVRGTLPRFRYDQLMHFGWKRLFPLGVANVLATGLMIALFG